MNLYIASSLKNHVINARLAEALKHRGFTCFLPQTDSSNYSEEIAVTNTDIATLIFERNRQAIDDSDCVIVLAKTIGTDTAWECGYAIGRGIPVIILEPTEQTIEHMYMVYCSVESCRRIEVGKHDFQGLAEVAESIDNTIKRGM